MHLIYLLNNLVKLVALVSALALKVTCLALAIA